MSCEDAFEALYRDHYWAVTRYVARRLVSQQEDVRDVVADVFAVAWRRRAAVPPHQLAWLYGVARHVVSNEVRRRRRQRRLLERLELQRPERADAGLGDLEGTPVAVALEELSPADQEVLRLAAWEHLTTEELATALRCSRSAAAMRLSRARTRLRERLGRPAHPPPERLPEVQDEHRLPVPGVS